MTKIIEGDLILTEDYKIDDDLIVKGSIYGEDGMRYNINARNINALDINAGNINAWDINAWDINAGNINARNINAWDINALDINALDINAGNIEFYAVCFAYNDIKCKSIKGERNNCRHFVLDGTIEIKGEKT